MDFIGDIDLLGLLSVVIFYLIILGVGMWAAGKKSNVEGVSEEVRYTRTINTEAKAKFVVAAWGMELID